MGFLDRVEAMDSDMITKVLGVVAGLTVVMPATKSLILKVSASNKRPVTEIPLANLKSMYWSSNGKEKLKSCHST